MTEQNLIKKDDEICLLEDNVKCFLIDKDGFYMNSERMIELAYKMLDTAERYGSAIDTYNKSKGGNYGGSN